MNERPSGLYGGSATLAGARRQRAGGGRADSTIGRVYGALLAVVALAAPIAGAAQITPRAGTDTGRLPPIEISAMRDPVAKSYRKIMDGVAVFERRRDLAPRAPLRFKLLPRQRETDMGNIALRIVGETIEVPIAVAADNTFTIPRDPRLLQEDAVVVPNRKAGSLTWRTDIRTPGLPPNVRRLGDLRLECRAGMESGLIPNYPTSVLDEILRLLGESHPCDVREPRYFFFAERPLWSVTLVHGERRQVLPVDWLYAGTSRGPLTRQDFQYCDCAVLLDRTYFAPLGDTSWPDDTLLELEYMVDS